MKTKLNLGMLVLLGTAMLNVTVAAQNSAIESRTDARVAYAVYDPGQNAGLLRLADWDDRHRCDGDHDRDDRHCYWYWRGRDDDRYRDQYYYRGNGYYPSAPVYGPGGWYDRDGRWHGGPNGWYDRKGRWHWYK